MCRSDNHQFRSHRPDPDRLLSTQAFYLKLKLSDSAAYNNHHHYYYYYNNNNNPLSDSLTLLYIPRINACPLEVNGSNIRPDSAAYVTLHRVVNADAGSAVFGTQDRIRVGEGVRFEVYIGEEKLLKGKFSRQKVTGWRVDCTCVLEREIAGVGVVEAEVCVAVEGGRMKERVAVGRRRRRRMRVGLEEIPEEEESASEVGPWTCSSEDRTAEMEYEMEGVRWAVDVGIWVVCLGVGYLVSKAASAKTLRRRKTLL